MTQGGEFGKSMAFLSFTYRLCFLSCLERRERTSEETSGMSASGNLTEDGAERERLTGKHWITLPILGCLRPVLRFLRT